MDERTRVLAVKELLDKAYEECFPYLPPVRLDISITTACDGNCAYCWHQVKSGSRLTFDIIRPVIDSLVARKPPKLNITGGEPTIWPEFEKLVGYARDSGIKSILLCTNGRRLADIGFAERIAALGITGINISVDTLDADKFKALRGYEIAEIRQAIANCIAVKKKYPDLYIALCSVISKQVTPEELLEVKEFCGRHGLGYFAQTFYRTSYPLINKKFSLSREEKEFYHRRLVWLRDRVGEAVKRTVNPFTDGNRAKCYKGITTVKLSSDGKVSFCWNSRPVGNILKDHFNDIWVSRQAKKVREYIRDKKCNCGFDCDVFESLELLD
ncbi:MAG: radical SAM protein [Candidatus Omnitrophota bacterium]|jgi:molybdenum cofactor biosynthesis enzyme MoaA|nr:radical SAM protein [Candidatus Omnitrophota bacterium]MDD5518396.1 radical SAM protein [Candidatus Omnitrophota bacterium]